MDNNRRQDQLYKLHQLQATTGNCSSVAPPSLSVARTVETSSGANYHETIGDTSSAPLAHSSQQQLASHFINETTTTTTTSDDNELLNFFNECCSPHHSSSVSFNCTNQSMYINHRELNFSQLAQVWLVKSWQEILLRVSFVIPIVLLGILGNLTIIYSICKFKRFRSKPTNIFILNMAIADLLTTIVCPTAALFTDIYQFYALGSFLCRFEGFIKITCLLVSAYSLIVLSFDWLMSVVRPCRTRITIKGSWFTLVSIWIVSILMASPLFVLRRLRERQWKDLVEVWCCECKLFCH